MEIGILLFPDNTQLDLAGPQEVFSRVPEAKVRLIAAELGPVASDNGLRILPDLTREQCPPMDILCVPGGAGVNALIQDDAWLDFIASQGRGARFVTSVCTGALALGAAGLLKGYKATTHWLYLPILEACGGVPVAERVVRDRNRWTGGGVTAGIDMALALAGELSGLAAAQRIQLAMEYNPRPPFQSGHPSEAPAGITRELAEAKEERDYFAWRLGLVKDALSRRAGKAV